MPSINIVVRIGALVQVQIEGETAEEIANALHGYDKLNKVLEGMFSDLAERVYPDDDTKPDDSAAPHSGKKEA